MSSASNLPTLGATTSAGSGSSSSGAASQGSSASNTGSVTSTGGGATLTNAPQLSSNSTSSVSVSGITGAPSLSSESISHLTGLPTLSGFYSYPPPTVPPMNNAPYLAKTNLPENFVFIIVGGVIAFVALAILAWRIITSWSINKRFARNETSYTPLADFKTKPSGAGKTTASEMKDLSQIKPSGDIQPKTLPRNFSSGAPASLFFSPTAEAARQSQNAARTGSRPTSKYENVAGAPGGWMPGGHYRDASRT